MFSDLFVVQYYMPLWEKRVKVDAVTVEINQTQINIKVQWSLNDGNVSDSVEVNL